MKYLLFFLAFITCSLQAQVTISGIVKDASSLKSIPFASVSFISENHTTTNVNGKFKFETENAIDSFTISYIGYETQTISVSNKNYFVVLLLPKVENQSELKLFAQQLTALDLIKKVVAKKNLNNPQSKLENYACKAYNKLVISANPDSLDSTVESVYNPKKKTYQSDSTNYKFKKFISKQNLFQTEVVSQFQFSKNQMKETVLGLKMSGLKKPIYEIIGYKLQPYSIYDDKYELFETKYVSPISEKGIIDYDFKILDTLKIGIHKSYLVYFINKKKINENGLEGILYINENSLAITKAIIQIQGVINIESAHQFDYFPTVNLWIPSYNEVKIIKGKNDDPIKILGGTIYFEGENDEIGKQRKKEVSDITYVLLNTHFYDLNFSSELTIANKSYAIEIKEDALKKEEDFWKSNSKEPLTSRDLNTYKSIDSLSIKRGLESKLIFGRKIINGYVPLGPIDFDLRYLLSFNNYEGFRIGLGGITNNKFSKKYRLDGYMAEGLKDLKFKYQLGVARKIDDFSNTWFGVSYTDDIQEIASTDFYIEKRTFKIYDQRPFNVSTFYQHNTWRAYLMTKILPKSESIWQLTQSKINPLFDYSYRNEGQLYNNYNVTTAAVSIQWNPFSNFMYSPDSTLEIEKKYPNFTFQLTQTIPNFLDNNFVFTKIDLQSNFEKKYVNGQKTSFFGQAGLAFGDAPLTHLYNASPNSLTEGNVFERITVSGKNSFETMYFNEFFSSKYVMLHFKHGFKRITIAKKVKPMLVLVTRMAWGDLVNKQDHVGIDFKTMNKGYFESGIELNQIFKGFGLGTFYRYGAYSLPVFQKNLSIKVTFNIDLGF
jgi:hypothetical protein